jgi:DNA polymerase-3 subunit delta
VDRRGRWVKAFSDPAVSVECDAPKGRRPLVSFIRAEAGQQGVELDDGAVELLADRIGPQLLILRQEITKVGLLAGDGETVTARHVAEASSSIADQPVWDLTDAIGAGQPGQAIEILARLQASGAAAPMILAALAGHFRKLAHVRSGSPVAGPPFVVRKLESQARRYSPRALRGCLERIHGADTALKGLGTLPPDITLEDLVIELSG